MLIPEKATLKLIQDYVPRTKLEDNTYDIVISTELIASLPIDDFRLYFSELARLVKTEGSVLISTPLDIQSEDALERFVALVDTEFHVHEWFFSYHYLYLKLCNFLKAPSRFVKAHQNSGYRRDALQKRHSIGRWWFRWNSAPLPAFFWFYFQHFTTPLLKWTEQSPRALSFLEKLSRFFWPESGISHVICIGKRHPLAAHLKESEIPWETKHKKQIWE
jgi:SAM-dependent methyltransferase